MIFNDFQNLKLSALGMGTMRLPTKDEKREIIDEDVAKEMFAYAIAHGVNYFDTAWGYHASNSEPFTGKVLSEYPRDSYYLASKFPGYDLANMDKVESIFPEQLKRARVEYFDFYLFHNVCNLNIRQYLDPKYRIYDYLIEQRDAGKIKHLGFSDHGNTEILKRFLDAYGEDMEFCQIQLNYLDWSFQDAEAKVNLLNEHNIPIWVMEPFRGGKLANLSEEHALRLKALRPDETAHAWAFRFLQSIPNVTVTLTGASDMQQMKENVSTFEEAKSLNKEEFNTLLEIADEMTGRIALPCTDCRYCIEHCPEGLDIPALLELYNEHCFTLDSGNVAFIAPMAVGGLPRDKRPKACIGCGSCEAVCPQGIKISEAMADFAAKLKESK